VFKNSRLIISIIFTLICVFAFPLSVFAYSYGDPNKEDLAETFSIITARLNTASPDWNGAVEAYKVRRPEISSHFGESVAVTLDVNFENKDKVSVIANYKALLVMNLERRFDYAQKDINDYAKVKLLLAKAKGTFDVLQPYVEQKIPKEITALQKAFDSALEAIGNPGLFGVGQKPIQPEELKKQTSYILETVRPLFPYKAAVKTQKNNPPESTPANSLPVKNAQEVANQENKTEQTAPSTEQTTADSQGKESESATISPANNPPETDNQNEAVNPPANSEQSSKESLPGAGETSEKTDIVHPPMEKTDKTNPITSILIIVLIAGLGGGAVFLAKKKGFI